MEVAGPARKSVLLAEDDEILRLNLKKVLESLQWKVRDAANGLAAQTIFDLNKTEFDLIISDIKMPHLDGIQLLRHIREQNKALKFVLMTGFSEVVEAKQAYEMGANEFLAKPFQLASLREAINACFSPKPGEPEGPAVEPVKYCRIPVEEFISSSKLQTDIYVRLSATKYIKIAHAGDVVPVERLKTYMDKKIDAFYVVPEDLRKIVGLNLTVAKIANSNQQLNKAKRLRLFQQTASLIAQNCYYDGMNKELVNAASETIESTLKLATEDDNLLTLLSVMQEDTNAVYAHSVAVSAYSCMLGRELGLRSLTAQFRLSMAGLLHDIGKRDLPINVLAKSRLQMSAAEVALLATHPQRAKDILTGMPGIPEDVVTMVSHHHENNVGTGYPYGIAAARIHPLAKILCVAEVFCTAVHAMNVKSVAEVQGVIQRIWNLQERELDVPTLKALAKIFHYELKTNSGGSSR